ncbi:hypothetical protein ACSBR1_034175 [Camellia fascicularis]
MQLPVDANDAELEERIIQHLAAAAAMGRAHHHIARRDGPRSRSSVHGRPQLMVFSSHPNSPPAYVATVGGESEPATITVASPSFPLAACEALGRAALDRRSQDNVSIVIVDLGRTDWQSLPSQKENFVYGLGQAFATIGTVSLGIWMSSLLSA